MLDHSGLSAGRPGGASSGTIRGLLPVHRAQRPQVVGVVDGGEDLLQALVAGLRR